MAELVFKDPDYTDGAYRKHADSVRKLELDFLPLVANYWEPGKEYANNDIVRPRDPTGFAYQAGADGQSGRRTPRWPEALSGTVVDGSITWTAIAAGTNGLIATPTSPTIAVSPSGEMSVSVNTTLVEQTRAEITLSTGGVVGETYLVTVTLTAGSETLKGSLLVKVVTR